MNHPIVWTIAGSDSGGGAGIQADLHTFHALGAYGCSVIAALTAQNSVAVTKIEYPSSDMIAAQIAALKKDFPAQAIKLGMLGCVSVMEKVSEFLKNYSGFVACDPVMIASSGAHLLEPGAKDFLIQHIFPYTDIITPNLPEAEAILNRALENETEIEKGAKELLMLGVKSVMIKGGHNSGDYCQDYWTDGKQSFWLTNHRQKTNNKHGAGCTLSSALTACAALGYNLLDSLVIAKMYVTQGIRLAKQYGRGVGPVAHAQWPLNQQDLPWITDTAVQGKKQWNFSDCGKEKLGLYPIVDSSEWLKRLLPLGIKTIQLRIKHQTSQLEQEIKTSIALAEQYQARLFINDHWQLAIQHNAYGVHLGQEDLTTAEIDAIAKANLRLGISTHCYYEVARAHAFSPSYMACGPIFETTSKIMKFTPQGIENLQRWRQTLNYPLVAIGGINRERIGAVHSCGVEGIAMISAITQASELEKTVRELQSFFKGD